MKKVELVTGILDANDVLAKQNRELFRNKKIFLVNLMSSPGSGKTAILERTIASLQEELAFGVVEGDIYTTKDAERIQAQGVPVVQINTEGACHLDASMVAKAFENLPMDNLDVIIIENVGNLVCPAEFDLGQDCKAMVLSTTEGNDKPWKYPLMFREAKVVILNKIDLLPYTDFDVTQLENDITEISPNAKFFALSAKTNEGMAEWCAWLKAAVKEKKQQ